MQELDPREFSKLGESGVVEFKESLRLHKEGLKALCSMVNSDAARGEVWFGVADDGSICGIEPGDRDSVQQTLAQRARNKFDPPLICTIELFQCEGRCLLRLAAHRAPGVPYHDYDGRAYIREGSTSRRLSHAEKQLLGSSRNRDQHHGPWKCDHCGAVVGMLSQLVITDQGASKSYGCDCGGEYWPIS